MLETWGKVKFDLDSMDEIGPWIKTHIPRWRTSRKWEEIDLDSSKDLEPYLASMKNTLKRKALEISEKIWARMRLRVV